MTVTRRRAFGPSTLFGAPQCDPSVGPNARDGHVRPEHRPDHDDRRQRAFRLTISVRRIITVQGREVDCALEPCTVGAALLSGTTPIEATSAPISFDPDVPAIPRLHRGVHGRRCVHVSDDRDHHLQPGRRGLRRGGLNQVKGGRTAFAFGFSEPIACSTTPTDWTVFLSNGQGRFTGGTADFVAFASAFDGFDFPSAFLTGEIKISGGAHALAAAGEDHGGDGEGAH